MKYEGILNAENKNVLLIVSRFNDTITSRLEEGAMASLLKHGASDKNIDTLYIPGAFEFGYAADLAARKNVYDGIVCLGCVIRGGTPHFEYVASQAASAVGQVSLKYGIPISFGILTTDSIEQALERSGTKMGNKGWEAAQALIELIDVTKKFS